MELFLSVFVLPYRIIFWLAVFFDSPTTVTIDGDILLLSFAIQEFLQFSLVLAS
jgi:hypothetical protein